MSFDNELKNLTIADTIYNRNIKSKQIPYDCPNYEHEVTIEGITYKPIIQNLEMVFGKQTVTIKKIRGKEIEVVNFERIEHLEDLYDEWKRKSSDTKDIKDAIIQKRYLIKMELNYWRKKLETFTIKEYKAGWRNSQLRDTQVITKYALPYLKTVFRKTEVQKGAVTAAFREIYKINSKLERKDRNTHAHHAIDAAVLTLIPPAAIREKILLAYNEEIDNKTGFTYHENPRGWKNFSASKIISIVDDVLINFQPQQRALTPTYKNVRKRGKLQFVKYKDADGKWHFKEDLNGHKIPLIAKGDSIRGQLHKESFFGAVKKNDQVILVERYPISTFTSINDCKNIVDDAVKEIVKQELEKRMANGLSFDNAKIDPIPFPNGKAIIKKVRCKVAAGRGYLTPQKALPIHRHSFISKYEYKRTTYAQNDENTLCLYYELQTDDRIERAFRIVGLLELAELKINKLSEIFNDNAYNTIENGKGKNAKKLPLVNILTSGVKVIFYREHCEELTGLNNKELIKRVFRIYKFNEMGTPNLFLQNHLEARKNELLDDGSTSFDPSKYQYRLKIKADKFTCMIEKSDFEIKPDGQIIWL